MDNRTPTNVPVTGGSSLLVIFAVLCLTVFALLGLSTVQAGTRLSQRTAQAVSDYYQADCRAEEIFARLRAGQMPADVTAEHNVYSYVCPISDTQQLCVQLLRAEDGWTVLRWQAESTAEWQPENDLNVWDGIG